MLSDEHLLGLANGDPESFSVVMRFAYSIAVRAARKRGFSSMTWRILLETLSLMRCASFAKARFFTGVSSQVL